MAPIPKSAVPRTIENIKISRALSELIDELDRQGKRLESITIDGQKVGIGKK
jgi:hypothetical protein